MKCVVCGHEFEAFEYFVIAHEYFGDEAFMCENCFLIQHQLD